MTDFRKPLDRTGVAASNLIVNEVQTLVNRQVRVAVPEFGAFFGDSLVVRDAANNRVLTPRVEYAPSDFYYIPSMEYGKGIYADIVIYNPAVSNNVLLTYQAVGGMYSVNRNNILKALDDVDLNDRPVDYYSIIARPHYLVPGPHQHDTGDTYGWEYVNNALKRLKAGMIQGRQPTYDKILADITEEYNLLIDLNNNIKAQLQAHVVDYDNPHALTAAQINVYTIPEVDAILAALNTEFVNRSNSIIAAVTTHENNKNNPHQLTPGQINAYTTAEFQARLADTIKKLSAGSDGTWVYLFGGVDSNWTWNNPYNKAVVVSNTMSGQGNSGVYQTGYVNGQLISEAFNSQTSDSDNKSIQGIFKVPVGGSLNIVSTNVGRYLAYAFVPKSAT